MHSKQGKNAHHCTFLHRTDILAAQMGCDVQDLAAHLGVSRRTLFAGRSDDSQVSPKTLLRLAAAERAAGIHPSTEPPPATERDHVRARDDTLSATAADLAPLTTELAAISSRLDKIEAALRSLTPRPRR